MNGVMHLYFTRQNGIMWAIVCIYQMYDLPVCMCVFMLAVLNAPDYAEVIKKAYNCITADTVMRAKI